MIVLTKSHLEEMESHARKERPDEACGVLAGKEGTVARVYPCENVSKNRTSRYAIAPEQLIDIFNDVADHGLEILGFYHSHPSGPLNPSNVDLAEATWDNCSYVIVHPGGIGSWIWDEDAGRFMEEEVRVI